MKIFQKIKIFFEDFIFSIKLKLSKNEKIKGKCKSCGECCKTIVFYVGENVVKTKEQFELLKKWDKKYNNFEISGVASDGALYFKCKALNEKNKCSVYPFRSLSCRMYPKIQTAFFQRGNGLKSCCGYYLEEQKPFTSYLK